MENDFIERDDSAGPSNPARPVRYGYVPAILQKLILTFERYGGEFPELGPIEGQVRALTEQTGPTDLTLYPCLRSLMGILRTAQLRSRCGRLLYLRVLGDVAHAQGKAIPKHPGEDYLDIS
ncbi:MAG: hypothetical protein H7Z75_04600 [Ferruginibacter sp.]|nr:hypothetical protein [Cytophagales bacterium]